MVFSPSPSMSSAARLTKWCRRSKRCAGQISPPVQRTSTSPSSATASLSHSRAVVGERVRVARLLAGQVLDHLRDHVAGALEDDAVADPHAQPRDLVAVVQRDVGDRDPADQHRGEPPDRGQLAGAADLDVDGLQRRLGALGGKLVRQRPARRLGDKAQPRLPVEPVDLVDHAVDVIGQLRRARSPMPR